MNYHIPANYTDAGRLFGLFEVRNGIESVVISMPLLYLCFSYLPFSLTTNIIITMIIVMPAGGFALIGIYDDCLTRFIRIWWSWYKKRGVITFRGKERLYQSHLRATQVFALKTFVFTENTPTPPVFSAHARLCRFKLRLVLMRKKRGNK